MWNKRPWFVPDLNFVLLPWKPFLSPSTPQSLKSNNGLRFLSYLMNYGPLTISPPSPVALATLLNWIALPCRMMINLSLLKFVSTLILPIPFQGPSPWLPSTTPVNTFCFTRASDKFVPNALYGFLLACFGSLFPLSSLFLLTFPFYFIHLIILDHSDILLDFRSILIEFLGHMLSPCLLVFLSKDALWFV